MVRDTTSKEPTKEQKELRSEERLQLIVQQLKWMLLDFLTEIQKEYECN